jgi:acyl-CoA thioester hydrolase
MSVTVSPNLTGARYETCIPIRASDTDMLGHVNSAKYVTYVEELMVEWLTPLFGDNYVTARLELEFHHEIPFGTRSVVGAVWVEKLGTSSVTFRAEIRGEDGEAKLSALIVAVIWDPDARRSRPMTAAERASLAVGSV